ncbi:unnamed protein product, partial [Sphagnum balticum]
MSTTSASSSALITHAPSTISAPITPSVPFRRSLIMEFTLGGLATMSAALFTNPIEVVKTRMQLQGELMSRATRTATVAPSAGAPMLASATAGATPMKGVFVPTYTNPFQAFVLIARREGLRGLQSGLGPAVLYQLMMNGTRLGAYEPIKRTLTTLTGAPANFTPINVLSGSTSGVLAAVVGSPFFLIKVRLQAQSSLPPEMAVGHQHAYRGALSGLYSVYRDEGIRGLYRGATAAMLRVGVGSGVQLSTYDRCKQVVAGTFGLTNQSVVTHLLSAMTSGLLVTIAMNPFDVISTRMYNQPLNEQTGKPLLYRNVIDCIQQTVRTEGLPALYKETTAALTPNAHFITNLTLHVYNIYKDLAALYVSLPSQRYDQLWTSEAVTTPSHIGNTRARRQQYYHHHVVKSSAERHSRPHSSPPLMCTTSTHLQCAVSAMPFLLLVSLLLLILAGPISAQTATSATTFTPFSSGNAFLSQQAVNDVSTELPLNNWNDLAQFTAFTLAFWTTLTVPLQNANFFVYEYSPTFLESTGYAAISLTSSSDSLTLSIGTATSTQQMPIFDGKWHHLTITFFDTTAMFYVNGSLVAVDNQVTISQVIPIGASTKMTFARLRGTDKLFGQLDDIVFFTAALTPQSVATMYSTGVAALDAVTLSQLVLHWTFDQNNEVDTSSFLLVNDSSGRNNNGRVNYAASTNVIVPSTAPMYLSPYSALTVSFGGLSLINSLGGVFPGYKKTTYSTFSNITSRLFPLITDATNTNVLCAVLLTSITNGQIAQVDDSGALSTIIIPSLLPSASNSSQLDLTGLLSNRSGWFYFIPDTTTRNTVIQLSYFLVPNVNLSVDSCSVAASSYITVNHIYKLYANHAPQPYSYSLFIKQDQLVLFQSLYVPYPSLIASGIDEDGDSLTLYITSLPLYGSLIQVSSTGDASNVIEFVPARVTNSMFQLFYEPYQARLSTEYVTDSFTFTVADPFVNSSSASANITLQSIQFAPENNNEQSTMTVEGVPVLFNVSYSGLQIGDTPYITILSLPTIGTLYQVASNGTFTNAISLQIQPTTEVEQWAIRAPVFSAPNVFNQSQRIKAIYGPPTLFPTYGDFPNSSWAPMQTNTPSFIWLHYNYSVYLTGIEVYETFNPGYIVRVSVPYIDLSSNPTAYTSLFGWYNGGPNRTYADPTVAAPNQWRTVWESDPYSSSTSSCASSATMSIIFSPTLCPPSFLVQDLIIHFAAVDGSWVEVDAVKMIGMTSVASNVVRSLTSTLGYVPNAGMSGIDTFTFLINSCLYWESFRTVGITSNTFSIDVMSTHHPPVSSSRSYELMPPSLTQTSTGSYESTGATTGAGPYRRRLLSDAAVSAPTRSLQVITQYVASQPTYTSLEITLVSTTLEVANLTYQLLNGTSLGQLYLAAPLNQPYPTPLPQSYAVDQDTGVPYEPVQLLNVSYSTFTELNATHTLIYRTSYSCLAADDGPYVIDSFQFRSWDGSSHSNNATISILIECTDDYLLDITSDTIQSVVTSDDSVNSTMTDSVFPNGTIITAAGTVFVAAVDQLIELSDGSLIIFQASAVTVTPPISVSIFDVYGQLSNTAAWNTNSVRVNLLGNGTLSGPPVEAVRNGQAVFDDFAITQTPGTTTQIDFTSGLKDGTTLTSTAVTVYMALCNP